MGVLNSLFGKKGTTTEAEVLPFLREIKRIDKPMGIVIGEKSEALGDYFLTLFEEKRVDDDTAQRLREAEAFFGKG